MPLICHISVNPLQVLYKPVSFAYTTFGIFYKEREIAERMQIIMGFGERLRQERVRRHLSQEGLAEALGVSPRSVARWEQDQVIPHASIRLQLGHFFGLPPTALFADQEAETAGPELWSVPYPRNPFFTGREGILQRLHEQLQREHTMALSQSWAISGLGGIGKTQIALEYAYQYRQDYHFVFWTNAATRETLLADLMSIADLLHLTQDDEQDQEKVIHAVKHWFATHQMWLWVLDNADDVAMVQEVLPPERSGHLLLTTRVQALGSLAQRLEVETMGMAEATLFLLRRAKLLAPDGFLDEISEEVLAGAEAISIVLDFLPLALDQAGAYIEEVACSLSTYLDLYRTHRKELLQRRGHVPTDHPEPVATTWSLSFERVEQSIPVAADLLRLCAFLEPDTIPEEIFSEGGTYLGPLLQQAATNPLLLNEAFEAVRRFSLMQRDPQTKTLRIHRLVQVVLKEAMSPDVQRAWAEQAVCVINALFPAHVEGASESDCRRFLAQAQACSTLIQDFAFTFDGTASLLLRTAIYLQVYALYKQAEDLFQRARHIREQTLGPEHPGVAQVLSRVANLYTIQGKYREAESLFQQAIHIWEEAPDLDHLDLAFGLAHLAKLFVTQNKLEQAETLFRRSLYIQEHLLGPDHPHLADSLNGLANLYRIQSQYEQAEPLLQRALLIQEQIWGPDHASMTTSLIELARLLNRQGKYEQAEPLLQRALLIREQTLGSEHPELAIVLNTLAAIYTAQSKYEQAEPLYQRALRIREQALGPDHNLVASVLLNLAELYGEQGKYGQAEPLCQRAVHIWEKSLGTEHIDTTYGFYMLATLYCEQGKYEQAEPLFLHALHTHQRMLSPDHPLVAYSLTGLANLYREQGKYEQAEPLYKRGLQSWEQARGAQHPDIAETLHQFAMLQEAQGKLQEAASLYQRALKIREQAFGPEHTKTTGTRTRLHILLQTMPNPEGEEQDNKMARHR